MFWAHSFPSKHYWLSLTFTGLKGNVLYPVSIILIKSTIQPCLCSKVHTPTLYYVTPFQSLFNPRKYSLVIYQLHVLHKMLGKSQSSIYITQDTHCLFSYHEFSFERTPLLVMEENIINCKAFSMIIMITFQY